MMIPENRDDNVLVSKPPVGALASFGAEIVRKDAMEIMNGRAVIEPSGEKPRGRSTV